MKKSRYTRGSVVLLSIFRSALLVLTLTLVTGGVIQSVPALAAPLDQTIIYTNIRYHLKIVDPGKLCVGQDRPIKVTALADIQGTFGGEKFDLTDQIVPGVTIKASTDDPKIATITPAELQSELGLPKNLVETYSMKYDNGSGRGEVVFTIHPKKAGLTNLSFTSTLGKRLTGGAEKKITPGGAIQVENCEYKINMNFQDIDSREGVTIWASGNLDTRITGEGGELKGTGDIEFTSGFVGPPCSITYSEFTNPTTITGQVDDNGQLTLQFAYQAGQITSNVSCPGGGGSGSQVIDMTNTGILSATFPEEGGTRMFRFSYAGSDMAPGTVIIDAEPVPEQAGS